MSLTIPPFGSASIKLRFKPEGDGKRTGELTFTSNTGTSPHSVELIGYGKPAGVLPPDPEPSGEITWLHTKGRLILDENNKEVRLRSCNWYGGESILLPAGLWSKPYKSLMVGGVMVEGILDTIARIGFNSVRLPICQDVTWAGRKPNTTGTGWDDTYVRADLNPDLLNGPNPAQQPQPVLTAIEIYDKIIAHCKELKLRVILDMHCLAPNDDNVAGAGGKWFTTATPTSPGATGGNRGEPRNEEQMLTAWRFLANRYKNEPVVCGFDLINEPFNCDWDDTVQKGVAAFYERCGAAIQAINPKLLLICEGVAGNVEVAPGKIYGAWWSGKLDTVRARPLVMPVANQVVYSPHDYGSFLNGTSQKWFTEPNYPENLNEFWRGMWGYLAEDDIAPVWVGEFGSTMKPKGPYTQHFADLDKLWLEKMTAYYEAHKINFAYWAINPPGEPDGILSMSPQGVWGAPLDYKVEALQPFLKPDFVIPNAKALRDTNNDMLLDSSGSALESY